MRLSKRDVRLIMILLSGLIAIGLWFFIARNFDKQREEVEQEIAALDVIYKQRLVHQKNEKLYDEATVSFKEMITEEYAQYPKYVAAEDLVLYAKGIEDKYGIYIPNLSLTESKDMLYDFNAKINDESNTEHYWLSKGTMAITYAAGYKDFKNVVDYINQDPNKMGIDVANVSYNAADGMLSCNIQLAKYALKADSEPIPLPYAPDGRQGTRNPFQTVY